MTEMVLTIMYLFVSIESVAIQAFSLWRLLHDREQRGNRVHRHMVRTVTCRVVVMSVYVGVGAANLVSRSTLSIPALIIFTSVALIWQANSLADARLGRDLASRDE